LVFQMGYTGIEMSSKFSEKLESYLEEADGLIWPALRAETRGEERGEGLRRDGGCCYTKCPRRSNVIPVHLFLINYLNSAGSIPKHR
jgi:hypothetical protein